MSTRAEIVVFDDNGTTPLFFLYNHSDGYPDGLGKKLEKILSKRVLTNGLSYNHDGLEKDMYYANTMGNLAVQIVYELVREHVEYYKEISKKIPKTFDPRMGQEGLFYFDKIEAEYGDTEYRYEIRPAEKGIELLTMELPGRKVISKNVFGKVNDWYLQARKLDI